MSPFFLNGGTKPQGMQVQTFPSVGGEDFVYIGRDFKIPYSEFCKMVEYFFTKNPLKPDDVRLQCMEKIRTLQVKDDDEGKRLVFPS